MILNTSAHPAFKVLTNIEMREAERSSLNRIPDMSDWEPNSRFIDILAELGQPIVIHRKAWEYALCIEGLEKLGFITPNASAISIGAGTEPPLYYLANRIARVVATDLYDNPTHEGTPAMIEDPSQFAPFPYYKERLEAYRMPGDALEFPNDTFDFAFSLSSIEHFGSRETQLRSMNEIHRVLRPGGVACIITELILNDYRHDQYFHWDELNEMFLKHPGYDLIGGDADLRISQYHLDSPIDLNRTKHITRSPHISFYENGMVWSSFSMFLQKKV